MIWLKKTAHLMLSNNQLLTLIQGQTIHFMSFVFCIWSQFNVTILMLLQGLFLLNSRQLYFCLIILSWNEIHVISTESLCHDEKFCCDIVSGYFLTNHFGTCKLWIFILGITLTAHILARPVWQKSIIPVVSNLQKKE